MNEQEIRYLGDVQRLALNPGDRIVLSVPGSITNETAQNLREYAKQFLGGVEVLVLADGIKLGVVGAE